MISGHCENSLGSFDELQNSAQAAVDPQTKSPDLGCESACRQLSSTTTIAIVVWQQTTTPPAAEERVIVVVVAVAAGARFMISTTYKLTAYRLR